MFAFKQSLKTTLLMKNSRPLVTLHRNTNQVLGLADYAKDIMSQDYSKIDDEIYDRVRLFHTDSVICGISAISMKTNAPTILRNEALEKYSVHVDKREGNIKLSKVFGSKVWCHSEKAIAANCAAVREWDSNGTVFGYNPNLEGHQAGEYGHNDFYPVIIAGCQNNAAMDGKQALKAMVLLDEIRGRLCEVFPLKKYQIDHVVHGGIACAVVYGTLLEATPEQIESAVGLLVSHYIPWRSIRSGTQLSDSKGASASFMAEAAATCVHRSMAGFIGPADIFRNKNALFRVFQPTEGNESPFDIVLGSKGKDFALQTMQFKLGLYEHQSASAIDGLVKLLHAHSEILLQDPESIQNVEIISYEPAISIIGDENKMNPTTRQSADHSMVYIIGSILRKAFEKKEHISKEQTKEEVWKHLMLTPKDYSEDAIFNEMTRKFMGKIMFKHGGEEFDSKYPEGIPTQLKVGLATGDVLDSGLIMFPGGHSSNDEFDLRDVLQHKFKVLGKLALKKPDLVNFFVRLENIGEMSNEDLQAIYDCDLLAQPEDH